MAYDPRPHSTSIYAVWLGRRMLLFLWLVCLPKNVVWLFTVMICVYLHQKQGSPGCGMPITGLPQKGTKQMHFFVHSFDGSKPSLNWQWRKPSTMSMGWSNCVVCVRPADTVTGAAYSPWLLLWQPLRGWALLPVACPMQVCRCCTLLLDSRRSACGTCLMAGVIRWVWTPCSVIAHMRGMLPIPHMRL